MNRMIDWRYAEVSPRAIDRATDDSLGSAIRNIVENNRKNLKIQDGEEYRVRIMVIKLGEVE